MLLTKTQSLRLAAVLEVFQNQLDLLTISLTVELEKSPLLCPKENITLNKLIQHCRVLSELMETFIVELDQKQTFSFLLKKIEEEKQRKERLAELTRRVTKADFREKQTSNIKLEQELQSQCAVLEELVVELALLETCEQEENEKNQMIKNNKEDGLRVLRKEAENKERALEDQIKLVKETMEKERRSHQRSLQFLKSQQEEMKQRRDQWEERIRVMTQTKTQQVDDVCCKIVLSLDRLMEKRRTYRAQEQVVMEDKEEQEKLRQQQQLIIAATKIQAFWRGCMVRKGLGIYKKPEEEKKGKKKDKGKDGKKKKKK